MNMRRFIVRVLTVFTALMVTGVHAEVPATLSDKEIEVVFGDGNVINLDGVQIRGNKELPQILYIVPWQEVETKRRVHEHDIILHSLSERRIKPVMPAQYDSNAETR